MRIQLQCHVDEQARAWRILRDDLRETRTHAAQLAADLVKETQRADRAEAEAKTARESLTKGHGELLAANQRLRIANTALRRDRDGLRRQLDDALGYTPNSRCPIDQGDHEWDKLDQVNDRRRCKKCRTVAPTEDQLARLNAVKASTT